jgi:hypothetical protein
MITTGVLAGLVSGIGTGVALASGVILRTFGRPLENASRPQAADGVSGDHGHGHGQDEADDAAQEATQRGDDEYDERSGLPCNRCSTDLDAADPLILLEPAGDPGISTRLRCWLVSAGSRTQDDLHVPCGRVYSSHGLYGPMTR